MYYKLKRKKRKKTLVRFWVGRQCRKNVDSFPVIFLQESTLNLKAGETVLGIKGNNKHAGETWRSAAPAPAATACNWRKRSGRRKV